MATVFWKGKQWIAQWYQTTGKRVKRGTGFGGGRREAERIAAEMETKDRRAKDDTGRKFEEILGRVGADAKARRLSSERAAEYLTELRRVSDPNFQTITLSEFLGNWCASKKHRVKPKTAAIYDDMVRRFSAALGAKVMAAPITELSSGLVEKALTKIRATGIKGSTANLDLRSIRQALQSAADEGIVTKNVASNVSPLPEDDSLERAPFEVAEVRKMITHPDTSEEWAGMILFGGHTGLRLRDVAVLESTHIEDTELVIRPGKTSRSRKTVRIPLTPPLVAWIAGKSGAFFPSLGSLPSSTLSTQFSRIMKRAGIPSKITLPGGVPASRSFHSLRHSFASWLAEGDIHSDIRQKLTGHSSAGVHAKYSHHDESLKRAITVLPDFNSPDALDSAANQ